ncbi:MAG: hypothetical protein PHV17_09000 [Candidatus Omnitrophica bacterium]|nr:hypothetical protein [Candidatus Omnitrophota bacterium]
MKGKKGIYISMQINRIKLNPEKAVLSCCDSVEKGRIIGTGWQCQIDLTTGCTGIGTSSQSS